MGLALALKARGHHPVLAMPAFYREAAEREGLAFHPVRPDIDPMDREMVARVMAGSTGTEFLVRELLLGSLRESHADLTEAVRGADLLVTHPVTFAGPVVALQNGLRWASCVLAPMSFFSRTDLPVLPPMPSLKRLEHVPGASAALVALARLVTRRWGEPVQELRAEVGLPRGGHPLFEGQHSPHLVLALFSPLLADPQPDWPARVRITGAIPYNGPDSARPLSPRLEAFLTAGPPPVVFTLGSSAVGAAGTFYHESVEAVRGPGTRAVLLTGEHPENRPAEPLPEGIHLETFAPHAALFPRAAVVVHQGGAGTLHQGLRSGRPMLVVPFAHDQPDNAYRAERLGVSRTLRPGRYRADRVREELRILLSEDRYAARAAAAGERAQAEDGAGVASDALEELLVRPGAG